MTHEDGEIGNVDDTEYFKLIIEPHSGSNCSTEYSIVRDKNDD